MKVVASVVDRSVSAYVKVGVAHIASADLTVYTTGREDATRVYQSNAELGFPLDLEDPFWSRPIWFFNRIIVPHGSRRQGIGSNLLTTVIGLATAHNAGIWCPINSYGVGNPSTEELCAWYVRHGFTPAPGLLNSVIHRCGGVHGV